MQVTSEQFIPEHALEVLKEKGIVPKGAKVNIPRGVAKRHPEATCIGYRLTQDDGSSSLIEAGQFVLYAPGFPAQIVDELPKEPADAKSK